MTNDTFHGFYPNSSHPILFAPVHSLSGVQCRLSSLRNYGRVKTHLRFLTDPGKSTGLSREGERLGKIPALVLVVRPDFHRTALTSGAHEAPGSPSDIARLMADLPGVILHLPKIHRPTLCGVRDRRKCGATPRKKKHSTVCRKTHKKRKCRGPGMHKSREKCAMSDSERIGQSYHKRSNVGTQYKTYYAAKGAQHLNTTTANCQHCIAEISLLSSELITDKENSDNRLGIAKRVGPFFSFLDYQLKNTIE